MEQILQQILEEQKEQTKLLQVIASNSEQMMKYQKYFVDKDIAAIEEEQRISKLRDKQFNQLLEGNQTIKEYWLNFLAELK